MEHNEHSSNSNSGNLSVQSSPFVYRDADVLASSEKLSSSSSSSSSLDNPFGEDDKDLGNKNDGSFKMQIYPAVHGVDFQASHKKSLSSSASSLNNGLDYEEERRDTSVGSLPMQTSLALNEVDDLRFSKESRSSSPSSSSSSNSLIDGHLGFDEQLKDKNSENLITQSFPGTLDGVDLQDCSKNSRSSTDSSSSLDSPLDGPFRKYNEHGILDGQILTMQSAVEGVDFQGLNQEYRSPSSSSSPDYPFDRHLGKSDEDHVNKNIGILMAQSSNTVDEVDIQVLSKTSRSSSTSSSSPHSPLNGLHRNKYVENSMMQHSPTVDGIDVQTPRKTSRSSSTSSSLDFSLKGPIGECSEESLDTRIEISVPQSSPDIDGVDHQMLRKTSRSSSTSSSSPNSHRDPNTGKLTMQSSHSVDRIDVQSPRKISRSSSTSSLESPLNGPYGKDNEESKDNGIENLIMQSSPNDNGLNIHALRKISRSSSTSSSSPDSPLHNQHRNSNTGKLTVQFSLFVDRIDVQSPRKTSRSSSISSPESPLNGPYGNGNDKRGDNNIGNLIMQSSPNDNGLNIQALRKTSRSSSTSSYSPDSPLNDSCKDTNTGKLRVQSSPCVDGVDVEAQSNTSRPFFSTSSSKNSPLNGPFKDGNEETRNTSIGNLMLQSSPGIDEVDVQVPTKTSRSCFTSSSSSDSSHDDPLGDKSASSITSLPELNDKATVEDRKNHDPVSRISHSKNELPVSIQATEVTNNSSKSNLGNMSTTESPPTQVMERPINSKYRIPSHVFARTKSNNPVDWSVASNESLFSIHMGNMSFTGDQLFLKPEDQLGIPRESSTVFSQMVNHSVNPLLGEPSATGPGHMFNYSSNQHPGSKATNEKSQELGIAEAAIETMKVISKEIETDKKKNSIAKGQISHPSAERATSNKSFAFPILTDGEKGHSVSMDEPSMDAGSSKYGGENQHTGSQKVSTPKMPPSSEPLEQQQEPKNPVGAQFGFRLRWLSCLPCCSFCH